MNEFALIRQYFERQPAPLPAGHPQSLLPLPASTGPAAENLVKLGIGDDCALLDPVPPGQQLAISTDMLVAGRHFFEGTDPVAIGHKALAVNLSDLAAMGARPVGFTLALALPTADAAWLQGFADGLFGLAARAACPLIGGDTTRGPLNISITVLGQVSAMHALRRDGARVGDAIWVSGLLGAAALAVARRSQGQPVPDAAARRLDWPEPRLAAGLGLTGVTSAAMDISDGLAGDLGHLLTYLILGLMSVFMLIVQSSNGTIVWTMMGEIFPANVRGIMNGTAIFCMWTANAIITWTFPPMMETLGGGIT